MSISGVVVDESGMPVPDAVVDFVAEKGLADPGVWLTDGAGRFRVEFRHDVDVTRRLRVRARGFQVQLSGELGAGSADAKVFLQAGASVVGRVTDPTGRPVGGVEVVTDDRASFQRTFARDEDIVDHSRADEIGRAITDDAGRFALEDLRPGAQTVRALAAAGFAPSEPRSVTAPAGDVDLRLRPGFSVEGTVRDPDGAAVENAHVVVLGTGAWPRSMDGVTDEAGRFRYRGLLAGHVTIQVEADGFLPMRREGVATGGPALTFVLSRPKELRFRVEDAEGSLLEDAWASVRDVAGEPGEARPKTEGEGHVVVRDVSDGPYTVAIGSPNMQTVFLEGVRGGDAERRVRLTPGLRITGNIATDQGHVGSMDVYAVPASWVPGTLSRDPYFWFPESTYSSGSGEFRVTGLAPGTYDLLVVTCDEDSSLGSVIVPRVVAGTEGLEVPLPKGVTIRGTLQGADGAPVRAHRLQAYDGRGLCRSYADRAASPGPEVLLQGLAPGRYDVVVWTPDGRALRAEGIEAPAVDAVIVVR